MTSAAIQGGTKAVSGLSKLLNPKNIQQGLQLVGAVSSLLPQGGGQDQVSSQQQGYPPLQQGFAPLSNQGYPPQQQGFAPNQGYQLPPLPQQGYPLPPLPDQGFLPGTLPQQLAPLPPIGFSPSNQQYYGQQNIPARSPKKTKKSYTSSFGGLGKAEVITVGRSGILVVLVAIYILFILIAAILCSIIASWLASFSDYEQNWKLKTIRNAHIAMAVLLFLQFAFLLVVAILPGPLSFFLTNTFLFGSFGYIGATITIILSLNFLVLFGIAIPTLIYVRESAEWASGGGRGTFNAAIVLLVFTSIELFLYIGYAVYAIYLTKRRGGVLGDVKTDLNIALNAATLVV
jgi:hypothetical protein